jgi:hypothetical protein
MERSNPLPQDSLHDVFEHLIVAGGDVSLHNAILVCRAWAAVGLKLLWRNSTARALERIVDLTRRQLYADHVQTLRAGHRLLDQQSSSSSGYADPPHFVSYPRLRHLSFPRLQGNIYSSAPDNLAPFVGAKRLELLDCPALALAHAPVMQRLAAKLSSAAATAAGQRALCHPRRMRTPEE